MKRFKLNNKGLSVVELVVTFALLMVLVIGMLEIIVELKASFSDKVLAREIKEFKETLTQVIQDDLIKKKAFDVEEDSTDQNCSNNKGNICYIIHFNNGTADKNDDTSKKLQIKMNERIINYDGIDYSLPDYEIMEFRDSAVWENVTALEHAKNDIKIKIDDLGNDNNILKIYIPYYIIDDAKNVGIDIVYPIYLWNK